MSGYSWEGNYEQRYRKQKKITSVLLVTTVLFAVVSVGSVAWGLNQSKAETTTANTTNNPFGEQGGPSGGNFGGQGGPGGGGMTRFNVSQFFNSDGSVNIEQVQSFFSRLPSGAGTDFLSRFQESITQAVSDGDITQAQADALTSALNAAAGGTDAI